MNQAASTNVVHPCGDAVHDAGYDLLSWTVSAEDQGQDITSFKLSSAGSGRSDRPESKRGMDTGNNCGSTGRHSATGPRSGRRCVRSCTSQRRDSSSRVASKSPSEGLRSARSASPRRAANDEALVIGEELRRKQSRPGSSDRHQEAALCRYFPTVLTSGSRPADSRALRRDANDRALVLANSPLEVHASALELLGCNSGSAARHRKLLLWSSANEVSKIRRLGRRSGRAVEPA